MPTQEKIMDRVRKMLDRANHPNTPEPEREICFRQADKLMMQHAIDAAMLDATKTPEQRRKPVTRTFNAWKGYLYWGNFQTILQEIGRTAGVRLVVSHNGEATLVGMSDDVDYTEMLWTTVYLTFSSKLNPRWESDLSFDHNVYNLKESGRKWKDIAATANENSNHVPWPDGGMLIRAYKRHCKMIGEEPRNHTQRHDAYRESFVRAFENTVCSRLEAIRYDRKEAAEESGAGIVLYDAAQAVDDAWYAMYPEQHPDAIRERREAALVKMRESAEQERQAREAMLSGMTEKQRAEFLAKEERQRARDAKANDRYWEQQARQSYDGAGSAAGRRAGQSVDFSRSGGNVGTGRAGELG